MLANSIDEVLALLDARIARAREVSTPAGYFPALYRRVTARVKEGIERGEFQDGPRMERLDVVFANRYLAAAAARDAGQRPTEAWRISFSAAETWPPIVLQHLLLGMNAHINLDLGIAAVEVAPGQALPSLRADFDRINEILASLVGAVKEDLTQVWPALAVFDEALGTTEDAIANFSMRKARAGAWALAEKLASTPAERQAAVIAAQDAEVATFGRFLWRPGWLVQMPALVVRATERGTVPQKIEMLLN